MFLSFRVFSSLSLRGREILQSRKQLRMSRGATRVDFVVAALFRREVER